VLPLLKNKMDLLIGNNASWSSLQGPWPTRSAISREQLADSTALSLHSYLSDLKSKSTLPGSAQVILGARHVSTTLVPGALTRAAAKLNAEKTLCDALGTNGVSIALSLLPGGRYWLAAAVPDAVVQPWIDALVAHNIKICSIVPELSAQLTQLARLSLPNDAIVAFPCKTETSLVFLHDSAIAGIDWLDHGSDFADDLAMQAKAAWHRLGLPEMKAPTLVAAMPEGIDEKARQALVEAGFQVQSMTQGAWYAPH
jgi:hypothetical protein